jgi:hypothetical protein
VLLEGGESRDLKDVEIRMGLAQGPCHIHVNLPIRQEGTGLGEKGIE